MKHRISVVSVSDYEPTGTKSWQHEKGLINALAEQDLGEPFELILVESALAANQEIPPELFAKIPELSVHYCESNQSAKLKDFGVRLSSGDYVAVLESDCIPSSNWLRVLLDAVTTGGYDAASGRTWYGEESSYRRVMSLLHRSWDDLGHSTETTRISNNGAIYRRELLERYPYPDAVTPFVSAAMRNAQLVEAGYRFWFARNALMRHDIAGLDFVWDYQRNKGHQSMASTQSRNPLAMPLTLMRKIQNDCRHAAWLGPEYLRWYDWPNLTILMGIEAVPFLAGCLDAVKGVDAIPGSAYR